MKTLTTKEVQEQYQDLQEFKNNGTVFYRNNKLREYLNKLLGSQIKVAFSTTKKYNFDHGLDWSGDSFILINHKDEVVEMGNSEWAFIQ